MSGENPSAGARGRRFRNQSVAGIALSATLASIAFAIGWKHSHHGPPAAPPHVALQAHPKQGVSISQPLSRSPLKHTRAESRKAATQTSDAERRLQTPPLTPNDSSPAADLPLSPLNPELARFTPTSSLFMHGDRHASRVALTFDAGSDAKAVPLILKELEARHVHATFFLTGRFCEKFPTECRAIADAGMELGNHSFRHPHFTRLPEAKIREELDTAEEAIVKACGRGAKPLFRFPYGDCDARTQRIVAAAGYQPIGWSLDSLDAFKQPKTADFVVERINSRVQPGYITLMHVSCATSAEALARIFEHLDKMGVQVAPVSELLLNNTPAPKSEEPPPAEKIPQ